MTKKQSRRGRRAADPTNKQTVEIRILPDVKDDMKELIEAVGVHREYLLPNKKKLVNWVFYSAILRGLHAVANGDELDPSEVERNGLLLALIDHGARVIRKSPDAYSGLGDDVEEEEDDGPGISYSGRLRNRIARSRRQAATPAPPDAAKAEVDVDPKLSQFEATKHLFQVLQIPVNFRGLSGNDVGGTQD